MCVKLFFSLFISFWNIFVHEMLFMQTFFPSSLRLLIVKSSSQHKQVNINSLLYCFENLIKIMIFIVWRWMDGLVKPFCEMSKRAKTKGNERISQLRRDFMSFKPRGSFLIPPVVRRIFAQIKVKIFEMIQIALNLNLPLFASQLRFDCLRANNFITHQKLVFFFLDVPSDILALLNKYGMLQRCSRCDKQIERWNKKKKLNCQLQLWFCLMWIWKRHRRAISSFTPCAPNFGRKTLFHFHIWRYRGCLISASDRAVWMENFLI